MVHDTTALVEQVESSKENVCRTIVYGLGDSLNVTLCMNEKDRDLIDSLSMARQQQSSTNAASNLTYIDWGGAV